MTASQASGPAHPWRDARYEQLLTGLRRFLRTDGEQYLHDPNIASVGLGHKVTGGRCTAELAVRFTVWEKRGEPEALAALGTTPIPEVVTVAGVRVVTDVVGAAPGRAPVRGAPGRAGRTAVRARAAAPRR